jgi:hypothetical protein
MNKILYLSLAITGITNIAFAATPTAKFEFETGAEYDSNLSVIELDQNSSEGDWSILAKANINGQWQATDKVKLKAGAGYSSKTHQDYSEFNLAITQAFVDASYDFQPITLGISYHHADAELDNQDFLTLQQRSVYVSRLINQTIFLRAAINDQDKDFPNTTGRNAGNRGFSGDAFFFFNQGQTFFTLGISNEKENTEINEFDYDAINVRSSVSHQFSLWNKKNRVQLGWRFDNRDYSTVTELIDAKRQDERRITTLEWELETNNWLSLIGKLESGNYHSNLASADYSETISSVTLKARF